MSSRTPPVLSGGGRRRGRGRSRRRARARRTGRARLVTIAVAAAFLVVAVSALLEPLTKNDSDSPSASHDAGPRLSAPDAHALGRASEPSLGSTGSVQAESRRYALDLSAPPAVALRFKHSPRAGLLFDIRSGRALWQLRPRRQLPIASLTKMMTSLLIVERDDPHDRVLITRRAVHTGGSGVGVLPKGKLVVHGEVHYVHQYPEGAGIGVHFVRLSPEGVSLLEDYIASAPEPARTTRRAD